MRVGNVSSTCMICTTYPVDKLPYLILEKLKYPLMDLYEIQQREHGSNILVAKYADKSQAVSVIDNFSHISIIMDKIFIVPFLFI